jgi:hypothetical protein
MRAIRRKQQDNPMPRMEGKTRIMKDTLVVDTLINNLMSSIKFVLATK